MHFPLQMFIQTLRVNLPSSGKDDNGPFTILPIWYLQSPTLCHRFVAEGLVGWTKPSTIQLYHYVDGVVLTSDSLSDLQQAAPMFVTPAKQMMGHQDSQTPKSLVVTIRKRGQGGDR